MGAIWGVGNLTHPQREHSKVKVEGILLIAQNNVFNGSNPDIYVKANVPKKIVVVNKDFVRHDFIVNELNVNTDLFIFRTSVHYGYSIKISRNI